MEKLNKLYDLSLFIFRRDLRLLDNTALIQASKLSKEIIPTFFLDERQIHKNKNSYFSSNCVQFMLESLLDLNINLNEKESSLKIFYGNLNNNLENIIKNNKINAIFVNEDYTPFSIKRDSEIKEICDKFKIDFYQFEDLMMSNKNEVMNTDGEFYKVYTHYSKAAIKFEVRKVDCYEIENFQKFTNNNYNNIDGEIQNYNLEKLLELIKIEYNNDLEIKGGREYGLKIIQNLINFKDYGTSRNLVNIPTTRLSAFLKFGCISIREVYNTLSNHFDKNHDLIKHLQVRDFFMKIIYFNPHVIGKSFKPEYDDIEWQAKEEDIIAWMRGRTGFPIVDASMRCLNATGYIHNKLRNLVCSFLVKDVLADWRVGEKYFASKLIDYDISLNNGGWQWTASTGTDPKNGPRIYNPDLQSRKLDPNCEFIIKWIPELKIVDVNHIHDWEKFNHLYQGVDLDYPIPIFSHKEQIEKAFKMFSSVYNK